MKKLLSALVCIAMLISLYLPAGAFSDLKDDADVQQAVDTLQMMGVINGYPDGRFHPGAPLSRSQFCKMAVTVMGLENQAAQYTAYTIFPDVRSNHWAAGYINLAVKDRGVISGYPDGRFAPDDSVTFGQGVTILMRMLGYTDTDVGMNWPLSYLGKAAEIKLTDGVYMGANDVITRAGGAMLFFNLLSCNVKGATSGTQGAKYINSVSAKTVDDVVIISNSAKAADGTENSVMVSGAVLPVYKSLKQLPAGFIGMRGTLVLDKDSYVRTFLPDKSSRKQIMVSEAEYTYITAQSGEKINIGEDVKVFWGGEEKTYKDVWLNVGRGMEAIIFFTDSSAIDYIIFGFGSSDGDVRVLRYNPSSVSNPFFQMFNISGGEYKLYKNGSPASDSDMKLYDVAVLNRATKTLNVSDFKLPGLYENAYPNTATPTKIKTFGTEFEVLPEAVSDLQKFKIGDMFMLLMTPDYKVAGAISPNSAPYPTGILTDVSDSAAEVTFFNGFKLSGIPSNKSMLNYKNEIVSVHSFKAGELSASKLILSKPTAPFEVDDRKVGAKDLAPDVRIFDTVNGSTPFEIKLSDILTKTVYPDVIRHVGYDYAGRANIIILNNVTYDAYIYGTTAYHPAGYEEGTSLAGTATSVWNNIPASISVTNSNGTFKGNANNYSSPTVMAGVAFNSEGKVTGITDLKSAKVTRSDFDGTDYIIIGTERYKISGYVQCYIKSTMQYVTLEQIKGFSEEFTVYYDRSAAAGGKIRIIQVG